MDKLVKFFKEEEGVTAVEYGLIAAAIALIIIAAVMALGGKVSTKFEKLANQMDKQGGS